MNTDRDRLTIPQPCKQSWEDMQAINGDKFCLQCSKTVVDMTEMTHGQIFQLLKEQSSRICARVKKSQLTAELPPSPHTQMPLFYKAITIASLVATTELAYAQNKGSVDTEYALTNIDKANAHISPVSVLKKPNKQGYRISGSVMDADSKLPLEGIQIVLKNTKLATSTDSIGYFSLSIPNDLAENACTFVFSQLGYNIQEHTYTNGEFPANKNFLLEQDDDRLIGEVVIISAKRWWKFWKK